MASRKPATPPSTRPADPLYHDTRAILEAARAGAYRAVNASMVHAYWHVGRLIVEHQQGGRKRAAYGEAVLDDLSLRLTSDFGKGFTTTNLKYMRSFYLAFPIRHALRDELALRPELSWTHYRLLLGVADSTARERCVRMFDAHARPEGDNPTIGLILCSRKNEAIAKYSVLSENRQIFAAKYVKLLPTEGELTREIERERRLIDAHNAEKEDRSVQPSKPRKQTHPIRTAT